MRAAGPGRDPVCCPNTIRDSLDTKRFSPTSLILNFSNGRGGGPEMLLPARSYRPLWQAHQMMCRIGPILNGAIKMGAGRGKRPNSPFGRQR